MVRVCRGKAAEAPLTHDCPNIATREGDVLSRTPGEADRGLRLQVYLARAGSGSRRAMEEAIRGGRVAVDGHIVTKLGTRVHPDAQRVTLDGDPVEKSSTPPVVIALHKPPGVLTTTHDPHGRPTVLNLLPKALRRSRLYPMGRLDLASEGLVLLTSDGELAFRVMHPRFGHEREYEVAVRGREPTNVVGRLMEGVDIGDGRPARAKSVRRAGTQWRLVLTEGRKRQVRRMFEALGMQVTKLKRIRIGVTELGELPPGAARELDAGEIASLRGAGGTGMSSPAGHSP